MAVKNSFVVLFFGLLVFFSGCKDEGSIETGVEPPVQNVNTPQLTEPADNSVISSAILKWSAFENASTYRAQLSMDANFLSQLYIDTVLSATELTANLSTLNTNINYYWRVLANLNSGSSTGWSAVWRFSIVLPPPPAPVLLQPANNSVNQPFLPLFDWEDTPTAQYYKLQISGNASFSSLLLDSSLITASQLQCPLFILNTNTQYFWRVQASNSNGVSISEWSDIFAFTTVAGPLPNSIMGRVRFADTNFLPTPDHHYLIAAYTPDIWPPSDQILLSYDSLRIQSLNNVFFADYTLRNLPNNTYFLAVMTSKSIFYFDPLTVGVFGCDTMRTLYSNCAFNPPGAVITGNNGLININILSWADTSKSIF